MVLQRHVLLRSKRFDSNFCYHVASELLEAIARDASIRCLNKSLNLALQCHHSEAACTYL